MRPRGTDAIPLPPRPNVEPYRTRAQGLHKACTSNDAGAVRAWAERWLEALATVDGGDGPMRQTADQIADEARRIEKDARSSHLIGDGATSCTLADAQLFLARLHDFASWPKFVAHIQALSRDTSPDSEF